MSQPGKPDYILILIVFALVSIGVLMVFSASPIMGLQLGDAFFYIKRHLFSVLVGAIALYLGYKINYAEYDKWSIYLFSAAVFLLFLVYVPGIGRTVSGARRWIDLGLISFQPSELAKLFLIMFLSTQLVNKGEQVRDLLKGVLPLLLPTLLIAFLVYRQPDLGTAFVIVLVSLAMLFIAGAKKIHLAGLVGLGGLLVLVTSITSKYRVRRLLAFLDPWKDPQNVGFHIIQSLIAVGSGGLLGVGLGCSKQKFLYLPQNYTDFIFAIFCEEMGFVGAFGIILLFILFAARGIRVALNAPDKFSMLLSAGIVFWIMFQMFINVAVVTGLLPTTGIPLPYLSYGGTSIVVTLFATGILLNISRYVGVKT
ncbi:putative lipid II flippase FtsW [Candidatus Margulisiibacteriota bacterium]